MCTEYDSIFIKLLKILCKITLKYMISIWNTWIVNVADKINHSVKMFGLEDTFSVLYLEIPPALKYFI